jgi:hypothetical protein
MGAWSAAILGNDTTSEVYERFIDLYNWGEKANEIAAIVLDEQAENIIYDKTNVWFGLALACWECKVLTPEIYDVVKDIIETGEDMKACRELDASEQFLKERQKNLDKFLNKISTEKTKARLVKKQPQEFPSIYSPGTCLVYKNSAGNYIGIYIKESEHFRYKGEIMFCFLDFETREMPDLQTFKESRLYGLDALSSEWKTAIYRGNVMGIIYEKDTRVLFFDALDKWFKIAGALKSADNSKWIFNYGGGYMNKNYADNFIDMIEKARLTTKEKFSVFDITLAELLDKV